ncbi:MAG: AarF/ABC1/UbiB kinase family protein [Planctomycetaceae bacterium]|nr:AarF/ABC1/UbiB kinase family protein [Planctomycetaceae bacterium]
MSNWNFLFAHADFESVLGTTYARFAPPVKAGLATFLEGLPANEQSAILELQAGLPPETTLSERLGALARQCPVLHKLGQVLARDRRLSPEFRVQLRQLESLPPTIPVETIESTLTRELGAVERLGVKLQPPLAEASVAVVVPFEVESPLPTGTPNQGVFKILKPGIEERLEMELGLLGRVGEHLDQRCEELGIPHVDYEDAFREVKRKLIDEVDLTHEQKHLRQAQSFYADDPGVQIPTLLDYSTPRVTAMERLFGEQITEPVFENRKDRRQLAARIVKSLVADAVFSRSSDAMFHGDPHAGNLILTRDGRVGIHDWSLTGSLGEAERVAIVQLVLGAITLDSKSIVTYLKKLDHSKTSNSEVLELVVDDWVARIRRGQFPGFTWLTGLFGDAVEKARLRFAPDLMLFRKSLHTLEGVIADVSADSFRIDEAMLIDFLRHFSQEWPRRWITRPDSRDFATRLSNFDISKLALSYPSTFLRFWVGFIGNLVRNLKVPETSNDCN